MLGTFWFCIDVLIVAFCSNLVIRQTLTVTPLLYLDLVYGAGSRGCQLFDKVDCNCTMDLQVSFISTLHAAVKPAFSLSSL